MINNFLDEMVLHLSLIPGIGAKTIQLITNNYTIKGNLYNYDIAMFQSCGLSYEKASLVYYKLGDKSIINAALEELARKCIHFFTPYNNLYSKELIQQETYPPVLYQQNQGNHPLDINTYVVLGVVSSRKTNEYGKRVIDTLLKELQGYNILILSGGAIGGDTIVHEVALKYSFPTIAVLGSGLSNWYPQQNTFLFQRMLEQGGALMSHFDVNQLATKNTFPIRNSVIAGLARALLVIQAGERSGTLITAQYALEYGKNIGAIPGYIDDYIMKESNNLIKQGALCVVSSEDILDLLSINYKAKNESKNDEIILLSELEKNVIDFCVESKTIFEISDILNIKLVSVYEVLFELFKKGRIKQDVLGNWVKI